MVNNDNFVILLNFINKVIYHFLKILIFFFFSSHFLVMEYLEVLIHKEFKFGEILYHSSLYVKSFLERSVSCAIT